MRLHYVKYIIRILAVNNSPRFVPWQLSFILQDNQFPAVSLEV